LSEYRPVSKIRTKS
jgi:hypothetical protein